MTRQVLVFASILGLALAAGCGDDSSGSGGSGGMQNTGDAQTPPTGPWESVQAWLDKGDYKAWACEAAVHDPIAISPHGKQRICSNDKLSGHTGTGEYPVGSAAVKELYDAAGTNIVGYAVYLHTEAGTTGASWYWFERVPDDSMAPHDANGIVADGNDAAICTGCHGAAGTDAMHPGHDFVYTQIE